MSYELGQGIIFGVFLAGITGVLSGLFQLGLYDPFLRVEAVFLGFVVAAVSGGVYVNRFIENEWTPKP